MSVREYRPCVYMSPKYTRTGRIAGAAFSYLTATDLDTLHKFAAAIGLKPGRFVNQSNFPHYRICGAELGAAKLRGAKTLSVVELSSILIEYYDENNQWIYGRKGPTPKINA